MAFRPHRSRTVILPILAAFAVVAFMISTPVRAQDDDAPQKPEVHGRKYKAPPETSHIEVTVIKGFNKKPIVNAAVIFHPIKDGEDSGTLEIKSDPDGKAVIDVIPIGTQVRIQVLANGFATFAEDYTINEATREILVTMIRPQAQISTYVDNSGKPSQIQPGVQEPVRPKKTTPAATSPTSTPPSTAPVPANTAPAPASKPQQ
jgi:hypothetical protein